jgi:hypothetical protein
MGRGEWKAEVSSMENEITETLQSLQKRNPVRTSEIRQTHLLSHIDRIQAKFFGTRSSQIG